MGAYESLLVARGVEADDLLSSGRLDRMARASYPFIVRMPAHSVS